MTFDISKCDFALLSSATLLSPEIAHNSVLLVLLSACTCSLEIKIRPSDGSSEIIDSEGTGRFSTDQAEATDFHSWQWYVTGTQWKVVLRLQETFFTLLKGGREIQSLKGMLFT